MNIVDALHDKRFFKPCFKDLETWHSWEVYLKALFGLPISGEDLEFYKDCTGLEMPSPGRKRESYVIAGRRSGKSYISAIIAVYLATFKDWSKDLAVGERGWIFIIANDKNQARIIKGYISDILNSSASFRKLKDKDLAFEIPLKNHVNIAIKTCNFRSLRGYTLLGCILEELAFYRTEDAAFPDREIITAVRPALATIPDSLLLGISTPHSKRGILFEQWKRHFGQAGGPLIWRAATEKMNPTIDKETIEKDLEEDPEAALSEWRAEWRKDISAFISLDLVEAVTVPGRFELPKVEGVKYVSFIDSSGGRQDSFTCAIAHKEDKKIILDLVRERKPPFRPEEVVKEYSEILKSYGLDETTSDRYAGEWVTDSFRNQGITVNPSERSKSEIYLEMLPLIANGTVELLDLKKIAIQFTSLERKTRAGGKDLIDNFYGHDDCINSAAGACVMANKKVEAYFGWSKYDWHGPYAGQINPYTDIIEPAMRKDPPEVVKPAKKLNVITTANVDATKTEKNRGED